MRGLTRLRMAGLLCLLVLMTPIGLYAGAVLFGRNLHVVLPGRVYRCAQPSDPDLQALVNNYSIRTVVNLRGCSPLAPAYLEEIRGTHRLDLAQEDVFFSAYRLPSVKEVCRLVEILDRADYPLVLHCRRGADRTGLASAIAVLLQTDTTPRAAARQLSIRYGHVALGRPANLDRFLGLYERWLTTTEHKHTRSTFRRWLLESYCPDEQRCRIEPIDVPASAPANQPCVVRVRICNTSTEMWRLRRGRTAGVHAGFVVLGPNDTWITNGRAGLYDADIGPGECRDFTLVVPPLHTPGSYRLLVDMVDEQQSWFFQAGSEPLERELEVLD